MQCRSGNKCRVVIENKCKVVEKMLNQKWFMVCKNVKP